MSFAFNDRRAARLRQGLITALTAVVALARQGNGPELILRSDTRLIQVSVVATDHKGRPVLDLKREDFLLFEDRRRREIRVFSSDHVGPAPVGPGANGQHRFSNTLDERSVGSGITVIVLDSMNTKWTDQAQAIRQVVKFLRQVQPEDRIAIYTIGRGGFQVLHDFTRDASDLLENLAHWNGEIAPPERGPTKSDPGTTLDRVLRGRYPGRLANQIAGANVHNSLGTMTALRAIAQRLEGVPGRKSLIWISDGFPELEWGNLAATAYGTDPRGPELMPSSTRRASGGEIHDSIGNSLSYENEFEHAMKDVSQANIAIYPIEASGLLTPMPPASSADAPMSPERFASRDGMQQTMLAIAKKTGGIAFVNNNDITGAIRTAIEDSRVTYTLGFYPDSDTEVGKFHAIAIKLEGRRDVTLRYRSGYLDEKFSPNDLARRARELEQAFWSPLDANAIPLTAEVERVSGGFGSIRLNIDPASLNLTAQDGKHTGVVDVLILQRNETGKLFERVNDTIQMNFSDATYERLRASGVPYRRTVALNPQATAMRVVVRDVATGNVGSLTIPSESIGR
jgi:VWFA-related protein